MLRNALRCLLILCLVMTGTGNAVASVSMAVSNMRSLQDSAATPGPDVAAPTTPCGHAVPADASTAKAGRQSTLAHPDDCDGACCAHMGCSCPCMQLAQMAVLPRALVQAFVAAAPRATIRLPGAHPSPAQTDVIRPPIG